MWKQKEIYKQKRSFNYRALQWGYNLWLLPVRAEIKNCLWCVLYSLFILEDASTNSPVWIIPWISSILLIFSLLSVPLRFFLSTSFSHLLQPNPLSAFPILSPSSLCFSSSLTLPLWPFFFFPHCPPLSPPSITTLPPLPPFPIGPALHGHLPSEVDCPGGR